MKCPDIEMRPLRLREEAGIIGGIPAFHLAAQPRNGELYRPFAANILGDGFIACRPLGYEDLKAIRDWCESAMSAIDKALDAAD